MTSHVYVPRKFHDVFINDIIPANVVIAEVKHLLRRAADGFEEIYFVRTEHCTGLITALLTPLDSRIKHLTKMCFPITAHGYPRRSISAMSLSVAV